MNCSTCQHQVQSGAKFCSDCGVRIAEISRERPTFEPFIKASVVAELVGCSDQKIRRMAEAGQIPAVPFPIGLHRKTWRFPVSTVQRWLDDLERKTPHQGVERRKSRRPEAGPESGRRVSKRTGRKAQ